ncbi:MAG: type III-B CRISPR module RAMP protein Cmr1 [Limnochordaceae bacterium]|nr:type III-B CRISPR module RAMP protein Cmr1 [Limnochordaceae bacterium]
MWASAWTTRTYQIRMVTPLFGGGPVAGQNDSVTVVRGSTVRGHLRFWWRATRGATCPSVLELRKQEAKIWGNTEFPSPVQVDVKVESCGRSEPWAEFKPRRDGTGLKAIPDPLDRRYPSYALFPFQGKSRGNQVVERPAVVTKDLTFRLILRWPADLHLDKDVEAAVWAWVNFGGLGARTRRGCGTLFCDQLSPSAADLQGNGSITQWYRTKCTDYGIELPESPRPWPTLPRTILARYNGVQQLATPLDAWYQVIDLLRKFRQEINVGRNPGENGRPFGRSRWPEADSLRRVTRQALGRHRTAITTKENAFPRAEFGLPIIFHFKDGPRTPTSDADFDPVDCELKPAGGSGRMASPLILKALAIKTHGGPKALPVIVRLQTESLTGVVVEFEQGRGKQTHRFDETAIRRRELASYRNSPLQGRSPEGSALKGFLVYAHENGFTGEGGN